MGNTYSRIKEKWWVYIFYVPPHLEPVVKKLARVMNVPIKAVMLEALEKYIEENKDLLD